VGEYQKAGVMNSLGEGKDNHHAIAFDEDF
jgi:hypothetical protein